MQKITPMTLFSLNHGPCQGDISNYNIVKIKGPIKIVLSLECLEPSIRRLHRHIQNPISCNLIGQSKIHLDTSNDGVTSNLNGRAS